MSDMLKLHLKFFDYMQQNASGDEFHLADYIFNSNTHPRLQSMLTKLPEKQQEKVNRNRKSPEK